MPIAARSAPNNGRVKEAKVSSCTRGTGKVVNGKRKEMIKQMLISELMAKLSYLNMEMLDKLQ